MIHEAMEYVSELTREGAAPKLVHESRTEKKFMTPDGEILDVAKDFPARKHEVETLDDLVSLANRFQGDGVSTPVVWYDESEVVLVVNDHEHRDDTVRLRLAHSTLFNAIASLDPKRWYDPKSFVRLLRVELFGALDAQTLLIPVQRVKFENGATTRVENARNRESLGREITSSVKTEVEFPEYVVLQTSIYTTPGVQTEVSIKAAVEVDPSRGEFQLAVLPDEIQKAKNHVLSVLGKTLATLLDDGIPCYQGSDS